jgi:hypothetical protein
MHERLAKPTETTAAVRLPLVAIEHYMLADDRTDYPMVFYARLALDRLPDREALTRAMAAAVEKHPLLSATVGPLEGRRRYWKWDVPTEPEISWPGEPTPTEQLDISRRSGVRLRVEPTDDGVLLTFEFHHACCDGLGALAFIKDVLECYAAARNGAEGQGEATGGPAEEERHSVAVAQLATRGKFGIGPLRFLLRLPLELLGALGVLEFLLHRPQPLVGASQTSPKRQRGCDEPDAPSLALRANVDSRDSCASHWPRRFAHQFTQEETRALRTTASTAGATLNDLLVRELFLTVGAWIDELVPSKRGAHIRVMVPVNLRTPRDTDLPATNVVAMINLDRRPRRWRNHRRMLRVLHWEMAAVKWARLGLTFIRAIQVTHYLMGKLQLLLAADKCQATCVLSNLGDPWRNWSLADADGRIVAGDVSVQQVELLPPIRALTALSIGVFTLGGRMTLAFHCDDRVLGDAEASELLGRYVERLRSSMT